MVINGIIAEYNPFHNGHKYQLEEAKAATGADYTIIAMSGNFMQRGTPALLDKYQRTKMALLNGADLVLEIPSYYACSSAEYFATGAVTMLDRLGVVNHLCFGSESGSISVLKQIATILLTEPERYVASLRKHLRQGLSYPLARNQALLEYAPSLSDYQEVLSSPNNILGIEYIKSLIRRDSSIAPFTTLRVGSDYHDKRLGEKQSSALAIRQAIYSRKGCDFLQSQMPESAFEILSASLSRQSPVYTNDLSAILYYKLLMEQDVGYERYLDVSPDLSDRIRKNLWRYNSFRGFCDLLKSKQMTYTRISRCLLHILLDMDKESMAAYQARDFVPYARVLGFRQDARELLRAIKESSSIPLLTKLANAQNVLSEEDYDMLKQELRINSIYEGASAMKARREMNNEYRTPIVMV